MRYLITLIVLLVACDPTPPLCGTPTNIIQAGPCPAEWNEFINEVVLPDVANASCDQNDTPKGKGGYTREEQPGYFKYTPTSTPASGLAYCEANWNWNDKTGYYEVLFSCGQKSCMIYFKETR